MYCKLYSLLPITCIRSYQTSDALLNNVVNVNAEQRHHCSVCS